MKRLIVTLTLIAGLFEGCRKYEDGPSLSLRTPLKRIFGTYTLQQYTVNGVDSLSLFSDSLYNILKFFHDDATNTNGCTINGIRSDGKTSILVWTWRLEDNDETLNVVYSSCLTGIGIDHWSSGTGPFIDNGKPSWKILRLTNKELKMESTYSDKKYLVELIQ